MPEIPSTPQGSALPRIPSTWRSLIVPILIIILVIVGVFIILLVTSSGGQSFSWSSIEGQKLGDKEIFLHTARCVEHYTFLGEGALETGRIDICRSVQDADARTSCEAQMSGNAARCETITDNTERALCKARSGMGKEACAVLSGDERIVCEALTIEDGKMCAAIQGAFARERCLESLSYLAHTGSDTISLSVACEKEIRRIAKT